VRVDAGVLTDASLASSVRLAWRLFRFLRADWGDLFRGIALGMASSALGLLLPMLTSKLVDEMYPARDESLLLVILAGVGFITVLSTLLGAVRSYVSQLVGGKIGSAFSLFL
jgi:ABC-type bacteriocin/lantibiotic exporter with double-glycine peptidase domain